MTLTQDQRETVLLELDYELVRRFRRAARERDLPVARLIKTVLDIVDCEKLVDAILDDGPPKRR